MSAPPPSTFRVQNSPSNALALTNALIFHPRDLDATKVNHVLVKTKENGDFVLAARNDQTMQQGYLGAAKWHRQWVYLSIGEDVQVLPFDIIKQDGKNSFINTITLQLRYNAERGQTDEFDGEKVAEIFKKAMSQQIFTVGQQFAFDFVGSILLGQVADLTTLDISDPGAANAPPTAARRGLLFAQSQIDFRKDPTSCLKIKGGARTVTNAVLQPNFKFEDMGIGGLGNQFSAIFRRAFASRICPPALLSKLGIQHVKGLILYGPPGTGKTLIARQIAKFLNANPPKIVNGPEILNKYVGASEENIRNLFADAEKEYREKGDESSLHIIVFDELDAICKQRGGKNDGTGVGDSVVNQLLSKLDGVEQLNNILVIGMTNRLDMIDEALLRPGRLEVHMEISLPDEKGRLEIIKIHTHQMSKHNLLHQDVQLPVLASKTKNFSGAEIAGLVKSASSFAMNKRIKVETGAQVTDLDNLKVSQEDFERALDEIKPAFGVSEAEVKGCVSNGIINFSPDVQRVLDEGAQLVKQVQTSEFTPLISILLHGGSGTGKTAMAATIALESRFPFVKLISPETMIGFSEQAKVTAIAKIFNDAYKSELSCVVVDGIERLLDWVPIGPRFSNAVLQTLIVCLRRNPPPGKKLIILGTTHSRSVLREMDMLDSFNAEIQVNSLNDPQGLSIVLQEIKLLEDHERAQLLQNLRGSPIRMGIKKVLMLCERARLDLNPLGKLVESFAGSSEASSGGVTDRLQGLMNEMQDIRMT